MDEEERGKYDDLASEAKVKYQEELAEYKRCKMREREERLCQFYSDSDTGITVSVSVPACVIS